MSVVWRLAASFLIWAACVAPPALAQTVVPTPPTAQAFGLGALKLAVLRDGALDVANDRSVFGLNTSTAGVAKVLAAAGASTKTIRLDVDALLIRMPGHVVLIDTGYGPDGHGVLLQSLARAGVAPAQVTDVLITHAHPDHVGGLLDAQGHSAFPKAAIRLSQKEWTFLQGEGDTKPIAAVIAPQVRAFAPGAPILPGITPIALYGHTPGHVGYEIASQGKTLFDMGDIAHSSIISLARPDWTIQFDADKAEGAQRRKAELQHLATAHTLIFAPHFPYPGVGHIAPAAAGPGAGYVFKPGLPTGG